MTGEEMRKKLKRELRKTPKTAAELGQPLDMSGRGVGRELNAMVNDKEAVRHDGRPPKYSKP